ncbi:MAG: tail fiber domain-containing protein [Bacteroidota bacterium]
MTYRSFTLIIGCYLFALTVCSQGVAINETNNAPDASAMLDVSSTTKGVLIPRMTTTQREDISTPATGLLVYDSTNKSFWYFDGSDWQDLSKPSPITVSNENIFGGTSAGMSLTASANDNILLGFETGKSITNGDNTVAIGSGALGAMTGSGNSFNVAIGWSAAGKTEYEFPAFGTLSESPFNGFGITAVGARTLEENIDGALITAVGYQALQKNTLGADLTALGAFALNKNTVGVKNVAVGFRASQENSTGSNNTSIGFDAGFGGSENQNCTFVGSNARNDTDLSSYTNSTAIGYQAILTADNQVRVGNADVPSIGGQVAWSALSDGRFKTDLLENVPGLDFINLLRPVSYAWKEQASETPRREVGFIAQEVEKAADALDFEFDGVTPPQGEDDHYMLSYGKMVVPLVKAVQELQALVAEQQQTIQQLQARFDESAQIPSASPNAGFQGEE